MSHYYRSRKSSIGFHKQSLKEGRLFNLALNQLQEWGMQNREMR